MTAVRLRVTRRWGDGRTDVWETPHGDAERNWKRRMGGAGRPFRGGVGWAERDGVVAIHGQRFPYTDRLEWPRQNLATEAGGGPR